MLSISIAEEDGRTLKEYLEGRLVDLRREISHTDSPRFRETLYQLEGVLLRTLAQLPDAEVTAKEAASGVHGRSS
jgi:hypothetical protein